MMNNRIMLFLKNWITVICDPLKAIKGLASLPWYFSNFHSYKRLPGAEFVRFLDSYPKLYDRNASHDLDAHYYYVNAWAMRRVIANNPSHHLDVASQTIFAGLLSAVIPVTYVDYRPLKVGLPNLECIKGDILSLPFEDNSIKSVSCLHVAEHIGLGRYGDSLDPDGTKKAASELRRILARGGSLFFAVPIGKPRVCFNAHRIHSVEIVCQYFCDLELMELSGVRDDGQFIEKINPAELNNSYYALGMFWFKKPE